MHYDDPWKYEDVKDCHILIIVLNKALSRVFWEYVVVKNYIVGKNLH